MIVPFLIAWVATKNHCHQGQVIAYLREENRILKAKFKGKRIHLTDTERRRLALLAHPIARKDLKDVATIATADTLQRWYCRLVVQSPRPIPSGKRIGRPRVAEEIEQLAVRMANENPRWGYRRIQGALSNVGYHIDKSTVRNILRRNHIAPAPIRGRAGMRWTQFIQVHWEVLVDSGFVEDLKSTITETRVPALARLKRLRRMMRYRALSVRVVVARRGCDLWTKFLAAFTPSTARDWSRSGQKSDEACTPMRTVSLQSVAPPLQPIPLLPERGPPGAGAVVSDFVGRELNCERGAPATSRLMASRVQMLTDSGDRRLRSESVSRHQQGFISGCGSDQAR